MMNPIARSLDEIEPHYTVVVVGSGYGGGVAASRLARAGQSVCVLERGREILPGEYPNTLAKAQAEMQVDTARGRLGAADGLFNLHVNPDMLALVGCGLGGTSLINANVVLEMDPRLFEARHWPEEFRRDPHLLATYAERARGMLDPAPYPADFPPLNKLQALEKSAAAMQQPFMRPPIAVNFVDQVNPFGVAQPRCTLCGDCTSGCNVGAKNTTLMNYLPDAHRHGAQVFTGARVSHVSREGDRWRVHFEARPGSVSADVVVLGAGSLGSTEILLRSRQKGLPLSDRLGERFSGNGDVLAVGYDSYWQGSPDDGKPAASLHGIGVGANAVDPAQYPGPCITGVIDMRHSANVEQGLVIEEGVIPGALASLMPAALFFANAQSGSFFQYGPAEAASRLRDAQASGTALQQNPAGMTQMAYTGPVARTQTYLVMSVDDSAGCLRLEEDRLRIDWPGAGDSAVIARDNALIKAASDAIQGQFIANPLWSDPLGRKLITVHPVGGCAMADDAGQGVVNHQCQVFASNQGTAVHPGLYVCDGSVLPGAVGVNPLLTITSVAERACQLLADERGWALDLRLDARRPLPPRSAAAAGAAPAGMGARVGEVMGRLAQALKADLHDPVKALLQHVEAGALDVAREAVHQVIERDPHALSPRFEFTEVMQGWVSLQAVVPRDEPQRRLQGDHELAAAWGRAQGEAMRFDLRVHTDDLHRLTSDPTHPAQIAGTVTCAALSLRPMEVLSGEFHLLTVDETRPEAWTMTYAMVLQREEDTLHFSGYKLLHQQPGSSWWQDLTTLYVRVHAGSTPRGRLIAQGVLTLGLEDLLWQSASIRVEPNNSGPLATLIRQSPRAAEAVAQVYLARFGGFFSSVVFRAYGGLLADLANFPAADQAQRPRRALQAPAPQRYSVDLPDGFRIQLTRYCAGKKGPVILAPGFSVRASSFATDTVNENLVEHLCARAYDVWLFDYRASPDSGSPLAPYTIDDIANIDWPAAVRCVTEHSGARDVQAIAHCVGSMSLLMALLNGMTGVRSLVSSQLTLHPVTDWLSDLKADLDLVRVLEGLGPLRGVFSSVPGATDLDHQIDTLAWSVPVPHNQQCKNPVCHRVFSIFGPSYAHNQLNHWTHTALMEMFGSVSLKPFEQLTRIMKAGRVLDREGRDVYLQPQRAGRLALPIGFIAGARNQLFFPETSARTLHWLRMHNDPRLYTRRVVEDYAHMDLFVGRHAAQDVYPHLVAELERGHALAAEPVAQAAAAIFAPGSVLV